VFTHRLQTVYNTSKSLKSSDLGVYNISATRKATLSLSERVTGLTESKNGGSGGARTRCKINENEAEIERPSQIASQNMVALSPDLSQVVTAWEKLPASIKAAILAIVKSAE
jgi:hypothetical protein